MKIIGNLFILEFVSGIESNISFAQFKTEKKPKKKDFKIDLFEIEKTRRFLPTLEEISRNHQLAKGDRLFLCGNLSQAEQVYREAKEPFPAQIVNDQKTILEPVYQTQNLQPGVELVRGTIEAYQTEEDWLEASITARQFALFNPKHPQSAEFTQLANTNLERYQDEIELDLTWNAIGNAIVSDSTKGKDV
jgi:hypothetical protein